MVPERRSALWTPFGPLKVRLSYEIRYERDTVRDVDRLDTSSRATLVLGF